MAYDKISGGYDPCEGAEAMAEENRGLSGNAIKLIAIIAMTVDHLTWTFFPGYDTRAFVIALHIIGRITAPVMWFFIAEGYHHTRSVKKYALRLFVLALISHFAYNFCFGIPLLPFKTGFFNQTGVVWSLFWGLILLCVNDSARLKEWQKLLITLAVCLLSFPADWSCVAAVSILFIGAYRGDFKKQMTWMMLWCAVYAAVYYIFLDRLYGVLQLFTCLAIPILARYNGSRGKCKAMGRLFYIYYPAHLVLCGLIRVLR